MTLDDLVGLLREQQLAHDLQVVGVSNVPLHGVLDGVGAGEELLARLLLVSTGIGVHVLIEQLPHVVGQVQDLEVLGILESSLELLGDGAVEGGLLHDLADQPLLAVQVVVVELLIDILEHGDPLDNVHALEEAVLGRPILVVLIVMGVVVFIVVPVVVGTTGTVDINGGKDQIHNDCDKDGCAQQGKGLCATSGVKEEKPGLVLKLRDLVLFFGICIGGQTKQHAS